jgi:hypothetical protein
MITGPMNQGTLMKPHTHRLYPGLGPLPALPTISSLPSCPFLFFHCTIICGCFPMSPACHLT